MLRPKRALAAIFGIIFATGALIAPATVAQNPTELSLWVFVDRHGAFLEKQSEAWNQAFPERPIKITWTSIGYDQMHDNLLAAFLGGTGAPDLVDIEIGKFSTFVKTEDNVHLLDLTDVVAPYLPDLIATRMAPYQAYGKQLGIDYHLGAYLLYYNRVLLDQAGIDPDTIKTWDDWVAAGKTFQEKVPDKSWAVIETNSIHMPNGLMLMKGGGLYNNAGELSLSSPQNAEAIQYMSDLMNVEHVAIVAPGGNVHAPEFYSAFLNGQVASFWMPQWYMTRFPDNMPDMCGNVIVRPMPIFEEGGYTTAMGGGTGTAVTDQTPPEEQQIAKDFLAWAKLTKESQILLWTELGFDPYRLDVYEDQALLQPNDCFSGEIPFQYEKAELGNVAPEYNGPLYPEARNEIEETILGQVVNDGVPAADALAAGQEKVLAGG
jgi:arabinosaccharide transport system substrate-binding protein